MSCRYQQDKKHPTFFSNIGSNCFVVVCIAYGHGLKQQNLNN